MLTPFHTNILSTVLQRPVQTMILQFAAEGKERMSIAYRVYILRSWCEENADDRQATTRRYSLEDAQTHRRRGFAELQALIDFLSAEDACLVRQSEQARGSKGEEQ